MIRTYRKTALMRAVQYNGTAASEGDIIAFMAAYRGVITDEEGREIGRRAAGAIFRDDDLTPYVTSGITPEEVEAHRVLFQDPEVKAVIWNDLHRYWNPLRLTDHVALDSQGCFYPISATDVAGSYTEVGQQ